MLPREPMHDILVALEMRLRLADIGRRLPCALISGSDNRRMDNDGAAELGGNIVGLRIGANAVAVVEDQWPVRREDLTQRAFLRSCHAPSRSCEADMRGT